MGRWSGKFVIGLTGNIGTGKSVVRRMLEHLGAYGIDADALSHRVIEKGAPGYTPVVTHFGRFILREDGEIDRSRLGRIVFSDPEGMRFLEGIIHPLVSRVTDLIIQRAQQPVIVIEAIKLLEGHLAADCDSIWVTTASFEIQLQRLVDKRKMSEDDARQRILAQSAQEEKIRRADVLIDNGGSFENTWRQVIAHWKKLNLPVSSRQVSHPAPQKKTGELTIENGKPSSAGEIAIFFNQFRAENGKPIGKDTIMQAFGDRAFLLLRQDGSLVGVAGWQVENLIARTIDLVLSPEIAKEKAIPLLIERIEEESLALQCEMSLVFVPPADAMLRSIWESLGYRPSTIENLRVPVWMEAARESMPPDTYLLFKQLREDRILRPI